MIAHCARLYFRSGHAPDHGAVAQAHAYAVLALNAIMPHCDNSALRRKKTDSWGKSAFVGAEEIRPLERDQCGKSTTLLANWRANS
jgi:hypothetical protein